LKSGAKAAPRAAKLSFGAARGEAFQGSAGGKDRTVATTAGTTRRDFLYIATAAVGAVGAAATIWPLIHQMNPDASVLALASIDVDLTPIAEGQIITVKWRGKPVFISHRTKKEIEEARNTPLAQLPDPQPDQARVKQGKDQWLVLVGVCTHLGCVPLGHQGDYDGWFCPCHGSHYDTSGRIRRGPAPLNLEVPPYEFVSDTSVRIG
jgi:ubiquinol-cytochrome c reductase iron-sulfur subunit